MALPPYTSTLERASFYTFRTICGLIFFFSHRAAHRHRLALVQRGSLLHVHPGDFLARSGRLFAALVPGLLHQPQLARGALRVRDLVRRGGGDTLRRELRATDHPLADVSPGSASRFSPTILAVATLLVRVSILLLVATDLLCRWGERLRGVTSARGGADRRRLRNRIRPAADPRPGTKRMGAGLRSADPT